MPHRRKWRERVARLVESGAVSQSHLARLAGVSQPTIQGVIAGRVTNPRHETVLNILRAVASVERRAKRRGAAQREA